ncbi:MAG: hypothetical protein IPM61_02245 [Chlorobi bacterium]|nr:hypothetical protein [Chlorobiota bacterium]
MVEVGDGGFAGAGGLSFSGVLRFNSSLLYPAGSTPTGSVVDGERLIGVSGELPAGFTSGEVGSYEFVATLGNAETTALKLTDVNLSSGSGEVEVEPGSSD